MRLVNEVALPLRKGRRKLNPAPFEPRREERQWTAGQKTAAAVTPGAGRERGGGGVWEENKRKLIKMCRPVVCAEHIVEYILDIKGKASQV